MNFAAIFPGQGSQAVGMLQDLGQQPQVQQVFAEASDVLGYDLWQLCQQGPESQLNQTQYTQPALLAAGVAVWRVLQPQLSVQPVLMAGHSLGEYSALVCAGALQLRDAVALVAERGRLMQAAVPEGLGAMAAVIGMNESQLEQVCQEQAQGQVLACANFNADGQIVIAGQREAVERAMQAAKAAGAKLVKLLPMSVPSHCLLMREAAVELEAYLANVPMQVPVIPVLQNVDADVHIDPSAIKLALIEQLYNPVLWTKSLAAMGASGVEYAVECGPGRVLAGLSKRTAESPTTIAAYDSASVQEAVALLGGI